MLLYFYVLFQQQKEVDQWSFIRVEKGRSLGCNRSREKDWGEHIIISSSIILAYGIVLIFWISVMSIFYHIAMFI